MPRVHEHFVVLHVLSQVPANSIQVERLGEHTFSNLFLVFSLLYVGTRPRGNLARGTLSVCFHGNRVICVRVPFLGWNLRRLLLLARCRAHRRREGRLRRLVLEYRLLQDIVLGELTLPGHELLPRSDAFSLVLESVHNDFAEGLVHVFLGHDHHCKRRSLVLVQDGRDNIHLAPRHTTEQQAPWRSRGRKGDGFRVHWLLPIHLNRCHRRPDALVHALALVLGQNLVGCPSYFIEKDAELSALFRPEATEHHGQRLSEIVVAHRDEIRGIKGSLSKVFFLERVLIPLCLVLSLCPSREGGRRLDAAPRDATSALTEGRKWTSARHPQRPCLPAWPP
mmetsp:Transcript_14128/g.40010  ORF Transcript_14128/g.40010 Transcript_14128/m.40010 type:complete len:337 (+) Transcript_14128:645-1655(+)